MTARETLATSDVIGTIPVPTFFGAGTGAVQELAPGLVALAGLYCDHFGDRPPAARYAAKQIRYYSAESNLAIGRHSHKESLVDVGDLKVFPLDPVRTEEAVAEQCAEILETGARLLILGGDYSLAPALLGGALRGLPGVSFGLLRLSSNMDLQPADGERTSLPGRRVTTSRIATMLRLGLRDVALLGVRGLVTTEENSRAVNTLLITAGQLQADDTLELLNRLSCWASHFSAVFVSFDVDVLTGAASERATPPARPGIPMEGIVRLLRSLHGVSIPIAHLAGHRPDFDVTGRTATQTVAAVGRELVEAMLRERAPCR